MRLPAKLQLPCFDDDDDFTDMRCKSSLPPAQAYSAVRDAAASRSFSLQMPKMPSVDSDDDNEAEWTTESSWTKSEIDKDTFDCADDDGHDDDGHVVVIAGSSASTWSVVATPKKQSPVSTYRSSPATPAVKRSVSLIAAGLDENRAPIVAPVALLVRSRPELSVPLLNEQQPFDDVRISRLGKRAHGASDAMLRARF